jgi:diguanylate cyclase (GGDEF)-like protein
MVSISGPWAAEMRPARACTSEFCARSTARSAIAIAPHRDGRALWVRVSVTAVQHPDGSLWGGVARVEPLVPTDPTAASPPVAGRGSGSAGFWSALHDPLTGAANRLLLTDRITLALAATERNGGQVAVLFCDLDDFKAVNDTFGHERGDQVLTAVVRRLQTTLRPDDTVARLGGDELVVAAHVNTPEHAHDLLHRVRAALDQPLGLPADPELTVGVSAGLAVGGPGSHASQLIADADQAMYAEKNRRRTRRPGPPD